MYIEFLKDVICDIYPEEHLAPILIKKGTVLSITIIGCGTDEAKVSVNLHFGTSQEVSLELHTEDFKLYSIEEAAAHPALEIKEVTDRQVEVGEIKP